MSSRNASLPLLGIAAALLLGSCGFQPMYGSPSLAQHIDGAKDGTGAPLSVADALNGIAVDIIPDRNGQILRNYLIDRLNRGGRPADPRYRLSIDLSTPSSRTGVQQDDSATRQELRMSATYRLRDLKTDRVVTQGVSRTLVGYPVLIEQYATLVAERDAFDKGLQELARDVEARLAAYMKSSAPVANLSVAPSEPFASPTGAADAPIAAEPTTLPPEGY